MARRPPTLIALLALGALAAACAHGASPATTRVTPPPKATGKGLIEGRVYTTQCTSRAATSCPPQAFRGSLLFCHGMDIAGPCTAARVGARGRYRLELPDGRYALIGAPARGNVVFVLWRWVRVGAGGVTTVNIHGRNLNR